MKKLRTQLFCMTLLVLMLIPLLGSAATDQKGILSQVDIRTSLAALKSGESGSIDITPVDAFGEPIPLDGLTARFQFVDASGNALSGKPLVLDQALLDNGGSFTVTQTDTGYRLDIVGGGQEALYLIRSAGRQVALRASSADFHERLRRRRSFASADRHQRLQSAAFRADLGKRFFVHA